MIFRKSHQPGVRFRQMIQIKFLFFVILDCSSISVLNSYSNMHNFKSYWSSDLIWISYQFQLLDCYLFVIDFHTRLTHIKANLVKWPESTVLYFGFQTKRPNWTKGSDPCQSCQHFRMRSALDTSMNSIFKLGHCKRSDSPSTFLKLYHLFQLFVCILIPSIFMNSRPQYLKYEL